jgi:peptidoglycan/LPS O-acetylase OafA/YrhL
MSSDRHRYLPALDGLRACAVMGVLLYHADISWASGGFLGVDLFFVLSGFLITTLVCERRGEPHGLRRFYARRALRLLPAVMLLLVANLVVEVGRGGGWDRPLNSMLIVLTYTTNWAELHGWLFSHSLTHLWSLAIEEQFYLVWPLLLLGGLRLAATRRVMAVFALVLAALGTMWCLHLWLDGVSWLGIYIRTEVRAPEILVGAALALFRIDVVMARTSRTVRSVLATAALAALGVASVAIAPDAEILYVGGFVVVAVLAGLVITAEAGGPWLAHRVLASRPLVVVGRLSYSLYLWHFFVFVVVMEEVPDWPVAARVACAWAVTAVAATASSVLVERPALRRKARLEQPA